MQNWGDIIVVEDGEWRAYDWHWTAGRVVDILIGGEALAFRHMDSFRRSDDREWDRPMESRSGVLIDLDRKRLLFFGDELMDEMPQRRALLRVLADVWAEYHVGWAYGGTRELADYLGVDHHPDERDREFWLRLSSDRYSLCQLVSAVGDDGEVRMWPLCRYADPILCGPRLLKALPGCGRQRVALKVIPGGGVHVDAARRFVGVWATGTRSATDEALSQLWAGWHVEDWDDRYEEHASRCGEGLKVPALNLERGADDAREAIRQRILSRWDGPASEALALASALSRVSPGFAAPDDAVLAGLVRPSTQEWAEFARACDRLGALRKKSA